MIPHPSSNKTTTHSERIKIDKNWKFLSGDAVGAESIQFDDSDWRGVDVPHDWSVEGEFAADNFQAGYFEDGHQRAPGDTGSTPNFVPRSDSYLPKGIGWYRKTLNIPEKFTGQRVHLEFEGVFRDSALWINGEKAGSHRSGYTGVVYDITPHLRGRGEADVLALRVDARKTEGWWYEGSGIYRHVWLMIKPGAHVPPWKLKITTPEVSYTHATINVRSLILNASERTARCSVKTTLLDPHGRFIDVMESEVEIAPSENRDVIQLTTVNNPELWSPNNPNLYTAVTDVIATDGATDSQRVTFGLRWFEFTANDGFFLNGRKLQLRGGCVHHDFGGLGTALPDRANAKTVEVLKEMGANLIRMSHNPAAPSLLDACDRLGMLVWAETRTLNVNSGAEEDLTNLIDRDANHPSIILWALANTAGNKDGGQESTNYLKALHALSHRLDPYRPTAVALEANADPNANGFAMVTDVVAYNGGGMSIDDREHELYPDRKIMISEYSSGRGARGIYEESKAKSDAYELVGDGRIMKHGGQYCSVYDLCFSHEKGKPHFAEGWSHVNERPWLAGGCMWSAIEYRGETTGWPIVTSQFGVLDICRFPKDAYYFYQNIWTDTPVFHVFPHWTWPGKEGQMINVWCYRNCCDYVDLFVNGEKVLVHERDYIQYKTNRHHLIWVVPYEPGTLTAVGRMKNGEIVCRSEIKTAGAPESLSVEPDRQTLSADGEDIAFITVRAHDAAGTFVPNADNEITVDVEGDGKLLGLCSGDPGSHESEKGKRVRLFNGMALVIVQNRGKVGETLVQVSSEGLKSVETIVKIGGDDE